MSKIKLSEIIDISALPIRYFIRNNEPEYIENDLDNFIEIGPVKVLSGLVKRINRDVKIDTINSQSDIEGLKI